MKTKREGIWLPMLMLGIAIGLEVSPNTFDAAAAAEATSVTIVYSTDIKGKIDPCGCKAHPRGGLAPRATYFDRVWEERPELLTLDAGDLFGRRTDGERQQTVFLCEQTASFGYDAIGLGEQDLNHGLEFLRKMMDDYQLPFTNANVRDASTGDLILPDAIIVERGGVRFGIVSVLDPKMPLDAQNGQAPAFRVDDPVSTLREIVPALRESCDSIILLSHLGDAGTDDVLRQVPGIDVAVVGHTYTSYKTERIVADTVVLAAAYEGRFIGRADLQLDVENGKVMAVEIRITSLDAQIGDDPDMAAEIAAFKERVSRLRAEERARWPRDQGSDQESFLGSRACRACHEEIYDSWAHTTHAQAFDTLRSAGMASEPQCLSCHTTGYRYLGGYDADGASRRLSAVQCEACHGYGSEHSRRGEWLAEARDTCVECHDDAKRPCAEVPGDREFQFLGSWEKIKH